MSLLINHFIIHKIINRFFKLLFLFVPVYSFVHFSTFYSILENDKKYQVLRREKQRVCISVCQCVTGRVTADSFSERVFIADFCVLKVNWNINRKSRSSSIHSWLFLLEWLTNNYRWIASKTGEKATDSVATSLRFQNTFPTQSFASFYHPNLM